MNWFRKVYNFYLEGFKGLSWGKPLWILILLKLLILFAVLRVFFFKPVLSGKTEGEKSDFIGTQLTRPALTDTTNFKE